MNLLQILSVWQTCVTGADPDYLTNPLGYVTTLDVETANQNAINPYANVVLLEPGSPAKNNPLQTKGVPPAPYSYNALGNRSELLEYERGGDGKQVTMYITEWSVYKVAYSDASIYNKTIVKDDPNTAPVKSVDMILFGFIPICGGDGAWPQYALCTVNDCSAIDGVNPVHTLQGTCNFEGSDWTPVAFDLYADVVKGQFQQLDEMKRQFPSVKLVASLGGWTLSKPFYHLDSDDKIKAFTDGLAKFLVTFQMFDGVDFDYEIPGGGGADDGSTLTNVVELTKEGDVKGVKEEATVEAEGSDKDAASYMKLMKATRTMLDTLSSNLGRDKYFFSIATNCNINALARLNFGAMDDYLSAVHLMTYDFSGAWTLGGTTRDSYITHQANLYPREDGVVMSAVSWAVDYIAGTGFPKNKLMVGVAMYGRGWSGVTGGKSGVAFTDDDGTAATGTDYADGTARATNGCQGTVQDGVIDYTAIYNASLTQDCSYFYDECAEAPMLFCENGSLRDSNVLFTYDNPRSVFAKGKYVQDNGLRGLFGWTLDQDNGHIINAMNEALGLAPTSGTAMFTDLHSDHKSCEVPDPPAYTTTVSPDGSSSYGIITSTVVILNIIIGTMMF